MPGSHSKKIRQGYANGGNSGRVEMFRGGKPGDPDANDNNPNSGAGMNQDKGYGGNEQDNDNNNGNYSNFSDDTFGTLTQPGSGWVGTNFNLDASDPMSGIQQGGYTAPGQNPSENLAEAFSAVNNNVDNNTGNNNTLNSGLENLVGMDNIGYSGMSTQDLSLGTTQGTSALSEMSLKEKQDYIDKVNGVSLSTSYEETAADRIAGLYDTITDAFSGVSTAADKAGYASWSKQNYTDIGLQAPSYRAYKEMTVGPSDLAGSLGNYAANTYSGLQNNTLSTLGNMSEVAGNLVSANYGQFGLSPTLAMYKGVTNLVNQTPSITNSYGNLNVPADFNVEDHIKKDKFGNAVQSLSSRIKGVFSKAPELSDYKDLGEFQAAKQVYQDKINASTNLEFDSYSELEDVTFKDNKIAASLTTNQYNKAVAKGMFTDPEMAAAYRSEAESNKAQEKEASKGGRPVNDVVANAADMDQDLTVLSEYGIEIYNQLIVSGYDPGYAYRHALQLE